VISIDLPAGDGVTSTVAQAQITGSAVLLRDGEGEPADTFLESAPVHVLVIAPGASASSITVQVTSALSGDVETLTLQGVGSIAYEGQIPTAAGQSTAHGDGILQISRFFGPPSPQDSVTVSYAASSGTVSDSAVFIPGRIAFVDARGEKTPTFAAGTEAYVRMELPLLNYPSLVQYGVQMFNDSTGQEEDLVLTETRRDSGVYVGSMPLDVDGSFPSSG